MFRNLINIFKLLIKLSLVVGLLLIIAIGGLVAIQEVMTDSGSSVTVSDENSTSVNSTEENTGTDEDKTETETQSINNSEGPENYTLSNRINKTKYSWDTWRDPDDPGKSDVRTEKSHIDSEDVEYHIFKKVNAIREERNLSSYEYSLYLSSVGRAHSEDMYTQSYFSHENPEGERIWNRFNKEEGDWSKACDRISENIAKNWVGQPVNDAHTSEPHTYWTEEEIAEAIVQQWMHSDSHRKAMLHPDNDIHGIGVYVSNTSSNDESVVYATQGFCDYRDSGTKWANESDTDTQENES